MARKFVGLYKDIEYELDRQKNSRVAAAGDILC
jgi:hypothetical protein